MARTKASALSAQGLKHESPPSTAPSYSGKVGKGPISKAQEKAQKALEKLRSQAEKAKVKEVNKIAKEMEKAEKKIEADLRREEKKVEAQLATALRKEAEKVERKALKATEKVEKEGAKGGRGKSPLVAKGKESAGKGVKQTAVIAKPRPMQTAIRSGGVPASIQSAKRTGGAPGGNDNKRLKLGAGELPFVGEWDIRIPNDEYGRGDDDYYLSVHPKKSEVLEGAFHIAPIEGTIRFDKGNLTARDRTASFKWRGRETGEMEIQLGSNYKGSITLKGSDELKGWYNGAYGKIEFEGTKVSSVPHNSVTSWDSFSEESHEYERVARWGGKWGGW